MLEITIKKITNGFLITNWDENGERVERYCRDLAAIHDIINAVFAE